jgi:selenocysteine lyase/cysteine desulfurase
MGPASVGTNYFGNNAKLMRSERKPSKAGIWQIPGILTHALGSFGTYPLPVRNALRGYQKLTEACPDKFLRYQYIDLLDKARERVATIVNAPVDECVFVPNATTGKSATASVL